MASLPHQPHIFSIVPRSPSLQPLIFNPLSPDGHNYLEWYNDIHTYLSAEDLSVALSTNTSDDIPIIQKWQALLVIRRHLDHSLRQQYIEIKDPAELWTQLKARFQHEKPFFLPQARMTGLT